MIEQLLKVVLDLTSAGMWEWDILHNNLYTSTEFERIHGLDRSVFGSTFDNYILMLHPDDRERFREALATALRETGIFRQEYSFVRRDGSMMPVEARGVVLYDSAHAPIRMIGACSDITTRRAYERSLDEYNATLEAILTAIPDPVYLKDSEGTYVLLNNAAHTMLSTYATVREGESILGKKDAELFPESLAREFQAEDREVLESGTQHSYENEIVHDGNTYHFELDKAPFTLDAYGKRGIVVVCRDVTAKHREQLIQSMLHEATSFLAESIETNTTLQNIAHLTVPAFADWCSIIMLNGEGTISHAIEESRTATRVSTSDVPNDVQLGEPIPILPEADIIREVVQTGVAQLFTTVDEARQVACASTVAQRESLRALSPSSLLVVPLRVRNRSIGVLVLALASSDGGANNTYTPHDLRFMEDIARRAAIAIDHANLYQVLKEDSIQKDRFLSILSHELRNPLAPVKNYLELLLRNAIPQTDVPITYEEMLRHVNNMRHLLDDLLDLSRVVHNKITLDLSVQDIRILIERTVESIQHQFAEHLQTLECELPDTPVWVAVDALRFEQIILNLLVNALKYSPSGGHTTVLLSEHEGHAVLQVKDTGIGIRPELTSSIFDLFSQGSSATRISHESQAQEGLGIGLTLARDLTQLHGGSIEVYSEGEGKGSEFVVRFPSSMPPKDTASDVPSRKPQRDVDTGTSPSGSDRTILVVDDNVEAARSLALLLETSGYKVTTAVSGTEALALSRTKDWQAIILDIRLNDIDGYTVAQTIIEEGHCKETCLIALTGYGLESDRTRALEVGFHHHFTKPVDIAHLESMLNTLKDQ